MVPIKMPMYLIERREEKMRNRLLVNTIIPFSNVDGPGNRFSIFLQECNLNCVYCHNVQTIEKCRHCGICIDQCPSHALSKKEGRVVYQEALCSQCDNCIRICPYQSTPKAKWYEVNDLYEEIEKVVAYVRGVTISGGEPTLQDQAIVTLAKKVRNLNRTIYIDTNGIFNIEAKKALIDAVDGFLFDVKALSAIKPVCGINQQNLLDNLQKLLAMNKIVEVRTVVMAHLGQVEETVTEVAKILKDYPSVKYRLIPMHTKGLLEKQEHKLSLEVPNQNQMEQLMKIAIDHGCSQVMMG